MNKLFLLLKVLVLLGLFLINSFLLSSCDGGLEPKGPIPKSFLNGEVVYLNGQDNWPPNDSVYAVRVVAFKKFPSSNIIQELFDGNLLLTDTLTRFVSINNFSIEIEDAPLELAYIVAVLQYEDNIEKQKVIGVYTNSDDNQKHDSLYIEQDKIYNIQIKVDFNNLPPMPF